MKLKHIKDGNKVKVALAGELGHHEAKSAISYIENITDLYAKDNIILDFSGITFMDSSGIAVVMNGYRGCRNSGRKFTVVETPDFAMKIFNAAAITGIVKIMERGNS